MKNQTVKKLLLPLLGVLAVLAVALLIPNFATVPNLLNIVKQSSYIAIPAVALTMVMITRGIDLSIGGIISLAGVVNGALLLAGMALPLAIACALLSGILFGFFNGLIVAKINIPPFISTYTMGEIAGGIALVISNGYPIGPFNNSAYTFLGNGSILGVPVPDLFVILFAVLGTLLLSRHPFGNHVYALGDNETVVMQEGISVQRIKVTIYLLSGLLAAVSGILLSARLSSAGPVAGKNYQLDCVAACIIGGVSMQGGTGKVFNSVLGAIFIGALRNALNMLKVHPFAQNLILGTLIIAIVAVNVRLYKRNLRSMKTF